MSYCCLTRYCLKMNCCSTENCYLKMRNSTSYCYWNLTNCCWNSTVNLSLSLSFLMSANCWKYKKRILSSLLLIKQNCLLGSPTEVAHFATIKLLEAFELSILIHAAIEMVYVLAPFLKGKPLSRLPSLQ
jgi:hypothetical protein